jgi:hypothetical protein
MTQIQINVANDLNIPKNKQQHIVSYFSRLIKDYKGNPVDMIKEISFNLKGIEKYYAFFLTGISFAPVFYRMNDVEKTDFLMFFSDSLGFNEDSLKILLGYMKNISRDIKETSISIKDIIDSKFEENEKIYLIFTVGMTIV